MTAKTMLLLVLCTALAGCKSGKSGGDAEKMLNEKQIHEALRNARPPQQFGFNVYPATGGIAMTGSARLHPRHMAEAQFLTAEEPVIKLTGSASRVKVNALLDTASGESWLTYDKAVEFKAVFFGLDGRNIPYRGTTYIGQVPAYAGVVSQMRIDQLFIENIPVFIRMATGPIGPAARGIQKPAIGGIIGYDVLQNFEFVQFNPAKSKVTFSSTNPYQPTERLLVGQAPILAIPGVGLAVEGAIDGETTPILLDMAGNYDFARNNAVMEKTQQVSLGEVVYLNVSTLRNSFADGLPRAGLQLLGRYIVTVCPRAGVVYFERPAP